MEAEPYHSVLAFISSSDPGDFNWSVIVGLMVILLLLFVSALMSGSEVAYFSLVSTELDGLKESDSPLNRRVMQHLAFRDKLLATILITKIFVIVGVVVIYTFITHSLTAFNENSLIVFVVQGVVITFSILFFSEIFPKLYANRFPISFARSAAIPLQFFGKLFWPISYFLIHSTSIVNRRLARYTRDISIHEISDAIEYTETHITDERNILRGIVKFANIDVCEIMKSRVDTIAAEFHTSYAQLLRLIDESGYSRIPVYEETFDHIKGILYIKDLLPHLKEPNNFEWQKLIRLSYFVPESKKINDLLSEFQTKHIHMAIVVDEYGGTSGIITMEDILEEIVGEISDESDEEERTYEKIDSNNFIFEGKTLLNDFYKVVGIDDNIFDEVKGEADTLAGLILELRGDIPKLNDKLAYKNFIFTIAAVDKRRIKKIKLTIKIANG